MDVRCKDGDLAVITKDEPGLEANVGRFLWVYGPVQQHPELGAVWETRPASDLPMSFVDGNGTVKSDRVGRSIIHPDAWMAPVTSRVKRKRRPPRPSAEAVPLTQEWLQAVRDMPGPEFLRLPNTRAADTLRPPATELRRRLQLELCIPIQEDYGSYASWFWFPGRSVSATAHWWVTEGGPALIGEVALAHDDHTHSIYRELDADMNLPWVFADGDWNTYMVLPARFEANLVPRFARERFDVYEARSIRRRQPTGTGRAWRRIRDVNVLLAMWRLSMEVADRSQPEAYLANLLAALPADWPTPPRARRNGA